MFLKETKVLNYKSFRHKIQVQNFSPGFNILIGLNGSGKSTFLEVVTLLFLNFKKNPKDKFCPVNNFLSDPFKKVFSIVQISIENSDRKIPLPKNVITIRRIIGRNLDKFLIFNQSLSPQQFFSFLDSLGFCRENFILQMKQGEQTKFKDLKSLARLDAIQNLIGGGVYSRFKVKAITLLKNIVFYKKKISQEVAKIKERVSNLSFNEPTPPKKKLIRATCFIFEKNCRKNFEEFTQGKLKKLKIERFDKSVFNLIFWGRNFVKKKKTFYIRLSNNQSFFNFSEKNFFSKRKFFCADTDCLRLRQLELNFKFSKIQKLEKIWEGKITTFNPFKMFLEFPLKKKTEKFIWK